MVGQSAISLFNVEAIQTDSTLFTQHLLTERMSTGLDPTIILSKDDGWWVAKDSETGVASQGPSREEALDNLDGAVALFKGETGRPPNDEELRELGVDPEGNTSGELPEILQ